jgi:hypothetical protein
MRNEREMAFSTTDIAVGLAAIVVTAISIYFFYRASSSPSDSEPGEEVTINVEDDFLPKIRPASSGEYKVPKLDKRLGTTDVERARSNIRTLTLKREILGLVLKRLFEAEDDNEVTREERVRLSRGYEVELRGLSEELKQSELIVTLDELETIRDDILKKFEATLNSTQSQIDQIMKELRIEEKKPEAPPPTRRRPPRREEQLEPEPEEGEEEPEEDEKEPQAPRPRSDVEQKLEQLRMEVLKELEELEKLEMEA